LVKKKFGQKIDVLVKKNLVKKSMFGKINLVKKSKFSRKSQHFLPKLQNLSQKSKFSHKIQFFSQKPNIPQNVIIKIENLPQTPILSPKQRHFLKN